MSTYPSHKVCSKCRQSKLLTEFYPQANGVYGRKSACSTCSRSYTSRYRKAKGEGGKHVARCSYLQRTYGMSLEEYTSLLSAQNASCAICQTHYSKVLHGKLCVDHCHESGKIRGLLCHPCNAAIGLLKEDEEVLYRAARYIRETT